MRTVTVVKAAVFLFAVFAVGGLAGQMKYVAVLSAEISKQSGVNDKLTPAEVEQITMELRNAAVNNLPRDKYKVMTTETVKSQGSDAMRECVDASCIIRVGGVIGADYIVRGLISKFQTKFTLNAEIYETKDGNLVASSESIRSEKLYDVLMKAAPVCADMYRKFVSAQNPPQPPANVPTPVVPAYDAYTLTLYVSSSSAGTVSVIPNQTSYAYGTQVTVTAGAVSGYAFKNWTGASTSTVNPLIITMDGNKTLTAVFESREYMNTFTDGRDGKRYKTAVIKGKTWMGENMNYLPQSGESWCYDDDNSNCDKYGRLYDWNAAKTLCPEGWHLSSRKEWDDLGQAAGGGRRSVGIGDVDWYGAGKKLKAKNGWKDKGNGTDDYGFSALPGGYRSSDGSFRNAGKYGNWWTDTEDFDGSAYYRGMDYSNDNMGENYDVVDGYGFSVRCVGNN